MKISAFRRFKSAGITLVASAVSLILASPPAFAAITIGGVALNIKGALGPVADLVGTVVFVVGLIMGAMGIHKFRQSQHNHQGGGMTEAVSLICVGAMLVALPVILGIGVTTMFGGEGGALTATGGLQSIQ